MFFFFVGMRSLEKFEKQERAIGAEIRDGTATEDDVPEAGVAHFSPYFGFASGFFSTKL
jgi:hypothetical protein